MNLRLAMWSGPRNISTAMMRAWENRADTVVWDEPFYAYYLAATGLDHPLRDAVIAAGEDDWRRVAKACTGAIPEGKTIYYQKQMTHHLLPDVDRGWLSHPGLTHCFLIRDPREVLLSYAKKRHSVTLEDIGFPQQAEIFDFVSAGSGRAPVVMDATDFLRQPGPFLQTLCERMGISFSEAMLSWPPGRRETDGVWGDHWYAAVWKSTGFAPYRERDEPLPADLQPLLAAAQPIYDRLYEHRLQI